MLAYRTPGVYFEWLDAPRVLTALRTDVAGFVGIAARGPLHAAVRLESWTQFTSTFGTRIPQGYLGYAVQGFFANGGQVCWVVRVADPQQSAKAHLTVLDPAGWPVVIIESRSEGSWASQLEVTALPAGASTFSLALRLPNGPLEFWSNLSMDPEAPRYVEKLINDPHTGSRLVMARIPEGFGAAAYATVTVGGRPGWPRGGRDGLWTLAPAHLSGVGAPPRATWGLAALETVDEVSIVAMPDSRPPEPVAASPPPRPRPPDCTREDDETGRWLFEAPVGAPVSADPAEYAPQFSRDEVYQLQAALVAHCERLRDRVAIIDPPRGMQDREQLLAHRRQFDSAFAALYVPWLRVDDPLRLDGPIREVPPSGHVAGIYARGDVVTGVHKPPANELVEGARDVAWLVDDVVHGDLNEGGVNVIRPYNGRGVRVMGARTLSRDLLWRYINVRRLLIMIEESIDEQTQWTVFEANNQALWRDLDRVARVFLSGLWRRGMLDGATADQAYSVTCDETANPPEEVDLGRLTCVIGVQPPYPAEFVVVRIGKTEFGTEFLETGGGNRG